MEIKVGSLFRYHYGTKEKQFLKCKVIQMGKLTAVVEFADGGTDLKFLHELKANNRWEQVLE